MCDDRVAEEGGLERAVALYRGPLLDGFHVSGSVEFETWLDVERAQLDRRYAHGLEALAGAAEEKGDIEAALGWWRLRAAHDPYNARVALRLMRALDRSGDRAGALRHARIHTTLLREEFDADPDPDLMAFAQRLRHEPPLAVIEGERLRVIAQLVDAHTGFHIWSEQYDGELRQAFAVQDSIAEAIAGALHLHLAGSTPSANGREPCLAVEPRA